jgi:Tol biopolymer transport system component
MNRHNALMTIAHISGLVLLSLVPTACAAGNVPDTTTSSSSGSAGGEGGAGGGIFTGGNGGGGTGGTPLPYDRWIAFDSDRETFNRDIYVMRPDGSGLKRMTTEAFTDREPAFASDGKRIAFASDRIGATMQIFIMTLPSLEVTQLTNRAEGADQPAWSADDKLIAFHSGTAVYTIGIDGMGEKKWWEGPDLTNAYQHPVFSPDGIWLVADRGNQISAAKLDGSVDKLIAPNVPNTQAMPTVAPTSALFAFTTYCTEESVWVAPLSGFTGNACSDASLLSPAGMHARRPAWGPLGFVAFESGKGSADIYIVPEKGGDAVNVTNDPADDRNPAWSPAEGADIPK